MPKTREERLAYERDYRKRNRDRIDEQKRQFLLRNPNYERDYYRKNRETLNKRRNARRAKHRPSDYHETIRGKALAEGLRSGFERTLTLQMKKLKVHYEYEPTKLAYVLERNYIPDFYLPDQDIYIEAKGKLTPEDRTKMKAVKKAYPNLDIRFVFMRGENKLTARGKTTYMQWAEKNGFPAAGDGEIPEEWLK